MGAKNPPAKATKRIVIWNKLTNLDSACRSGDGRWFYPETIKPEYLMANYCLSLWKELP
jgi:hypothetical protein